MNGRLIDYVLDNMNKLGFERKVKDSNLLRSHCYFGWLKKNINVYMGRTEFPIRIEDA